MDLGGRYSTLYQQQANPFQLSSEEPYDVEFRVPEFQGDGPKKSMPAPAAASLPSQDPAPASAPPEQASAPQVEADASERKPAPEPELDSDVDSVQEMAVPGFETPAAPPVAAAPEPELTLPHRLKSLQRQRYQQKRLSPHRIQNLILQQNLSPLLLQWKQPLHRCSIRAAARTHSQAAV